MERYELTKKISILGIVANLILLAAKLTVGFMSGSQAMIADGFNSAGDVFASVMTYAGNKIASKPIDENHPYGHGKAEYIFAMIISLSLIIIGITIFRSSLLSIIQNKIPVFSWWLAIIATFTIIIKLVLYFYTSTAGKKEDSLLIKANAEDHRNDVFVSSSMLLGITMSSFGIHWADGAAGMGIAVWIAYTGFGIFKSAFGVLMDTNMDHVLEERIMNEISLTEGIDHIDSVIAKPVGLNYVIIVKVSVPGNMTVSESHCIAGIIREKLRHFSKVEDVVVHINPV